MLAILLPKANFSFVRQNNLYISSIRSRYGLRSYLVCCSETGYAWNIRPYCGEPGVLLDLVPTLLGRLKNNGYHLYMDNFYNSVAMCHQLLQMNTHVCGTLRKNRGAPPEVGKATTSTLPEPASRIVRHNGEVLTLAWRDTKIVRMVTTIHPDEMVDVKRWKKRILNKSRPVQQSRNKKCQHGFERIISRRASKLCEHSPNH